MQTVSINQHPFVQKLVQDIKLLPRNTTKYPEFSQDEIIDFSSFIYALNVMGSGGDGNLTSCIHSLWKELSVAVQSGGLTEGLQDAVIKLHGYLDEIGFFKEDEPEEK